MLFVTDTIALDENEIVFTYSRASGPGGQNINKGASAVQLRFDLENSVSLPEAVRLRLRNIAGASVTRDGILIIQSQRYRTQAQNRQDTVNRLVALIRRAAIAPKKRQKTRPTAAAKARRLARKKRRSEIKRLRRYPDLPE